MCNTKQYIHVKTMIRQQFLILLMMAAGVASHAQTTVKRHHFTVAKTDDIREAIVKARSLPAGDTAYIHF